VHLRVSDLDRATEFYRDTLGFTVTADARPMGVPAVFLAAGDYHHHIGLNAFQSAERLRHLLDTPVFTTSRCSTRMLRNSLER
jgi:catechol-2,3-dioxygenase